MTSSVLYLLLALAQVATAPELVDLTRAQLAPADPGSGRGPCFAGDSGGPRPRGPLSVRLISLDKTEYSGGDRLVATVELRNRTNAEVTLPVALTMPVTKDAEPNAMHLTLSGPGEDGQDRVITGVMVFGAVGALPTRRILNPGQSLHIRFPAVAATSVLLEKESARDVPLSASVSLQLPKCYWSPPERSADSITVRFRR